MRHHIIAAGSLAAVAWAGLAGSVPAQSVADFYKDKTITFIIGSSPGGNYDTWARMMSRHWGRHIPGNPNFVAQNMPGGGHIKAANHLYNLAPKDGTVVGTISRNIPTRAVLNHPAVKYDPVNFNWIGSPELSNRVCIAMAGGKVKTAKDLFENELLVGGAGAGTAVSTTPNLLRGLLGMKFKLIEGYSGATDVVLAMERGEVQGICQTYGAFLQSRPDWVKTGKAHVLFNLESEPIAGTKIPSVFQFATTQEQKTILAFYSSNMEIGRPTLAPPGLPKERVEALRRSFDATMKDPKLVEEARKQGLEVRPLTGEVIQKRIAGLAATPSDLVTKTEKLLGVPEATVETVKVSAVEKGGRRVSFAGKKGDMTVGVSKSRTQVTIAGKKAGRSGIKAGMTCEVTHVGPNSTAAKIACR